jgi:hypothetical protein
MHACFLDKDRILFYKYLDLSKVYFEYGSGGSTYNASLKTNIKQIYSVESDISWHNKLKNLIKNEKVTFIYNEMDTLPNTWGKPGPNSTKEEWINYSDQIKKLDINVSKEIDLILIDGRFRVACCLKCFDVITNDCAIAFDDFLNREEYHVVLDYYDIVEKTEDERMVILKKKVTINSVPKELIEKYENIMN